MLKKILFGGLIALWLLTMLPLAAKATNTGLQPGTLIKAANASVYYFGADGKRYVFPNEKTFKTWFVSFDVIISISNELLSEIPIGGNVTYKPGTRLIKITTDPKVYYVDYNGTLRHIDNESIAKQLWGNTWYTLVDDLPDSYFVNYKMGQPLSSPAIQPASATYSINQDKALSDQADPTENLIGKINLTGKIDGNVAFLDWTTESLESPSGFKVVMSNDPNPVYPGNDFHYLSSAGTRSDAWYELNSSATYYFRVCQYLDGKCGIYSNNLNLTVAGSSTTPTVSNKSITLKLTASSANSANFEWVTNFNSPYGYKVVKSTEPNPVYPGNDYHYIDNANVKVDSWTLGSGTWHFRVCEYLNGTCGVYSNDLTVKIGTTTTTTSGTISLTGSVSGKNVSLKWTLNNMTSPLGFKIVKAEHINPVYPGDVYHYYTDSGLRSDAWEGLSSGTYHFRVCEYLGGTCGKYSNDLMFTVQ